MGLNEYSKPTSFEDMEEVVESKEVVATEEEAGAATEEKVTE